MEGFGVGKEIWRGHWGYGTVARPRDWRVVCRAEW